MDFNELVADFAARHGVENLTAEDGAAALDIDGITVTLVAAEDSVALSADLGEPPAEGRAAFADMLLEANLQTDAFFARNPEPGAYVVVRRLPLATLGGDALDAALESLVNQTETWRRLLADFRPAAESAAETEGETPSLGAGGFMQV